MKIRPLETHSKVLEVEYRLCKYPYLSKESLPGTADALVFQKLLTAHRMPTKEKYQSFYHWYIMMKQFAPSAIEGWIRPHQALSHDKLIGEILDVIESYDRPPPNLDQHPQIYWVISIQVKEEAEGGVTGVRKKLETNFKSFRHKLIQSSHHLSEVRLKLKLQSVQCEQLKDTLSRWDQVKRIEIKRIKKQPRI